MAGTDRVPADAGGDRSIRCSREAAVDRGAPDAGRGRQRGSSLPVADEARRPPYDEATARALAADHGWSISRDGSSWRRVVGSPAPISIVEAPSIRALVDAGTILVACGGGGIPVALAPHGSHVGVEAVIDKDSCAVLLAEEVQAHALLLLTDVAAVHVGWGTSSAVPLRRLSVAGAEAGVADGAFAPGSMGPKVAAAGQFVRRTGRRAGIGSLEDAVAVFEGRKGTMLVDEIEQPRRRAA